MARERTARIKHSENESDTDVSADAPLGAMFPKTSRKTGKMNSGGWGWLFPGTTQWRQGSRKEDEKQLSTKHLLETTTWQCTEP